MDKEIKVFSEILDNMDAGLRKHIKRYEDGGMNIDKLKEYTNSIIEINSTRLNNCILRMKENERNNPLEEMSKIMEEEESIFVVPDFEMVCDVFSDVDGDRLANVYSYCMEINWQIGGKEIKDWVSLIKIFLRYGENGG